MESPQQKQHRIDENKFKRTICKNAIWSYEKEITEEDGFKFHKLKNTGCIELRQNGSSHCLSCSLKYKKSNE